MSRSRGDLIIRILGIVFFTIGVLEFLALLIACAVSLVRAADFPPWPVFLFVLLHGGILGGAGLSMLLARAHAARRKARLLAEGTPALARVVDVEQDWSVRVNGRCAWRVVCEWEEGGTVYRFRSERLWEYPALNNEYVAVYRDPADPKCYYVDVEGSCRPVVEL